jgi:FAD/FMN-containing dehydrogenase
MFVITVHARDRHIFKIEHLLGTIFKMYLSSKYRCNLMEDKLVTELKNQVRGDVVLPQDEDYDKARKVYNAMIDKQPAVIVRCTGVADVIASVKTARAAGIDIAIRGGGHSVPGFGTADQALVIDLNRMKGIRVNPTTKTAWVEGGCTLGDVYHATQAFGLTTPGGIISTTGVGGLTLGGGIGYIARSAGLSVDNLLAADVVLADGSFVTASETRQLWRRHELSVSTSRSQGCRGRSHVLRNR